MADYLRRHPDFLSEHPELLRVLTAPERQNGDGVVDLQHFMIERLRAEVSRLKDERGELIASNRGTLKQQARVHAAVLDVLSARTFEEAIQALTTDLTLHLELDAVGLCVEAEDQRAGAKTRSGVRVLPPGAIDAILGPDEAVVLRSAIKGERRVFGRLAPLIRSEALLRLHISPLAPTGLLALGARDPERFSDRQHTEQLDFLARVVEATLRIWLNLPS